MTTLDRIRPNPIGEQELLLHVGVHKTGTTALQAALFESKNELAERGVLYPGNRTFHHAAITSFIDRKLGWAGRGARLHSKRHWEALRDEVLAWQGRVIVSSEFLDEQGVESARRVVNELGGPERTRVVVTLRSLAVILPSAYQQDLKAGVALSYDGWLKRNLDNSRQENITKFGKRHNHSRVVDTWATVLGSSRVTVVVLPEDDRNALFVAFAGMLDLPGDFFDGKHNLRPNRSFTAAEAELMLRINEYCRENLDWKVYHRFVRSGLAQSMVQSRKPDNTESKIATPQWAIDQALERDRRFAEDIAGSGVHVQGDLADLYRPRVGSEQCPPRELRMDAAFAGIKGLIDTSQEANEEIIELKASLAEMKRDRNALREEIRIGGPIRRTGRKVKRSIRLSRNP